MTVTSNRPSASTSAVALRARQAIDPTSEAGAQVSLREARNILDAAPGAEVDVARMLLHSSSFAPKLTAEAKDMVSKTAAAGNFFDMLIAANATSANIEEIAARKGGAAARVEAMFDDPNVRLAMMDPDMVRTAEYQKFVDGIRSTPLYETYHRDVRAQLKDQVSQILSESEATGTVVDATNVDMPHLHKFTKKLYDMVQETAREAGVIGYDGGPTEVEVKVLSDNKPNAYVYGLWNEKPRVHVISAIAEVFYDNKKGDWVNDKAKKILQSVIAHELWHIKDSPAEWRTWFGILVEASGLLEGHTDGPAFTAAQKNEMIAKGKTMVSKMVGHTACQSACCTTGFQSFVADERLSPMTKEVTAKLDISPEEATKALVDALGIDLSTRKRIERDEHGNPTKFGILQAIFQDSYQLTRAGEITADRGAFLVQGTNEWTAFMDYLLGTATDLNSFADTDEEKHEFMDRLMAGGYKAWVQMQSKKMREQARKFDINTQKDTLECVTHPPSLYRVVLGEEYMDRFRNPDAYPRLVAELKKMENPAGKAMEILRVMHKAKHDMVTRFVDPRGFDKADATALTQHGILYGDMRARWDNAIQRGLDALDEVVTNEALTSANSKEYKAVVDALEMSRSRMVVEAWHKTPMEQVTKHFIQRLEVLQADATGEARALIDKRLEQMWELHEAQLDKENAVFKAPKRTIEDKLKRVLKDIMSNDPS